MAKGKNHQPGGAAAVVEALVRPTVEGFGLRLWDVRFEKETSVDVFMINKENVEMYGADGWQ